MPLSRKILRLFLGLVGFIAGLLVAIAAFLARSMVAPTRQRLWATPADIGLDYEEVQFPAQDGLRVSGWFLPADAARPRDGATILLVHGWGWNRLGYAAEDMFGNLLGGSPVEFLRLLHALHNSGYNVLTFDMRNHGQSATARPVTFGQQEAKDLLGALAYVNGRSDVNPARIGAIGFSMGGNAVLFALPQTTQINAALVVQPTTPTVFARRTGQAVLGPLGAVVQPLSALIYRAFGGPPLSAISPIFAVAGAGDVPVLYLQGEGDQYGSTNDVQRIADATPNPEGPLFVKSAERFGGYQYLVDNPQLACAFFEEHL